MRPGPIWIARWRQLADGVAGGGVQHGLLDPAAALDEFAVYVKGEILIQHRHNRYVKKSNRDYHQMAKYTALI